MDASDTMQTTQFLLLSNPRTGCHLLDRILSKQSNTQPLFHPYIGCFVPRMQWLSNETYQKGMLDEIYTTHESARQSGIKAWQEALKEAESANQILMVHTHPIHTFSPELMLEYMSHNTAQELSAEQVPVPDAENFLLHPGTVPVFTIRDPRLATPSGHRLLLSMQCGTENCTTWSMNPIWSRIMYDWYVARGFKPIIIDADDYMTDEDLVRKFCREAGLNENEAVFHWPAMTRKENMTAEQEPLFDFTQQTLLHSIGMDPGRAAKNVDLEAEEKKWKVEFGEDGAAIIQEAVKRQVPHYKYLHERRLRL